VRQVPAQARPGGVQALLRLRLSGEFSETKINPFKGFERYNVAPTTRVPVIRQEPLREREIIRQAPGGGRELAMARLA
jgi:hypothetical protein